MSVPLEAIIVPLLVAIVIFLSSTARAKITYNIESVNFYQSELRDAGFGELKHAVSRIDIKKITIKNRTLRHIDNVKLYISGGEVFLLKVFKVKSISKGTISAKYSDGKILIEIENLPRFENIELYVISDFNFGFDLEGGSNKYTIGRDFGHSGDFWHAALIVVVCSFLLMQFVIYLTQNIVREHNSMSTNSVQVDNSSSRVR